VRQAKGFRQDAPCPLAGGGTFNVALDPAVLHKFLKDEFSPDGWILEDRLDLTKDVLHELVAETAIRAARAGWNAHATMIDQVRGLGPGRVVKDIERDERGDMTRVVETAG
jgi:hypothetical protein